MSLSPLYLKHRVLVKGKVKLPQDQRRQSKFAATRQKSFRATRTPSFKRCDQGIAASSGSFKASVASGGTSFRRRSVQSFICGLRQPAGMRSASSRDSIKSCASSRGTVSYEPFRQLLLMMFAQFARTHACLSCPQGDQRPHFTSAQHSSCSSLRADGARSQTFSEELKTLGQRVRRRHTHFTLCARDHFSTGLTASVRKMAGWSGR